MHIEHRLGHGSAHLSLAPALAAHGCALLRECQGNKFLKAVLLVCRLNVQVRWRWVFPVVLHTPIAPKRLFHQRLNC